MATVLQPDLDWDPHEVPTEPVRRFSVREYHRLLAAGVLHSGDPYELIDGWLVRKMTKNPRHELALEFLMVNFVKQVAGPWRIRCQGSLTLANGEPEPDLAVIRGGISSSPKRHPLGSEAALVIEVSEATLRRDRGPKLKSYALAKIPCYWIVNLSDNAVEVYTAPDDRGAYQQQATFRPGDEIPVVLDGVEFFRIAAADALAMAAAGEADAPAANDDGRD